MTGERMLLVAGGLAVVVVTVLAVLGIAEFGR